MPPDTANDRMCCTFIMGRLYCRAGDNLGGVPHTEVRTAVSAAGSLCHKEGGSGGKTDECRRPSEKVNQGGQQPPIATPADAEEQEVRQLKKENLGLRERLKVLPDTAQNNAKKDKVVASLKAETMKAGNSESITRKESRLRNAECAGYCAETANVSYGNGK